MSIILVQAGKKGGSAPKHKWTDDERDIVRRDYKGTNESAYYIADYLSRLTGERITFNAVKGQCVKMGLLINKSRRWTPKEEDKLRELIYQYSPTTIAKRLKRSVNSVVVKSKRLNCKRRFRDGWFTKREVCQILGVDHKKVQRWIDSGELKAIWNSDIEPQKDGSAYWRIDQRDLYFFIRSHTLELQGRNVDLFMIVEILAGVM